MIHAQNTKVDVLTFGTVATNATTSNYVDTLGFSYAKIHCILTKTGSSSVDSKWGSLVLKHSDDTVASNAAAISTGGTDFTIPAHTDSTDPNIVTFLVPLGGSRKRYLEVEGTPGSTHATTVCIVAELSRANEAPNTDAERGSSEVVFV